MVGNGKGGIKMAVYIGKDGTRYIGSMAERKKAEDAKKSMASNGSSSNSGSTSNKNVGSGISREDSTSGTASSPTSNVGSAISRDGSSGGNSQYTNASYVSKGTYNDRDLPADAKSQISTYQTIYNNAIASGDTKTADAAHAMAEAIRKEYGYSGGSDGSEYLPIKQWEENDQRPIAPQSDPRIDAILNEILNREDFSYDAMNDPLYQQYANMYHREGDRAMKETMAEAAAGAGGMNTYAITAAQQANSYYNSQLNDKIPELYQLAYQMYLQDKESKVQDLGILQDMDATQYNRYRDTINDYYADKNFAYGVYRDDVADSQWQATFDNNNYWANKEFDYNVGRDTIADNRYNTERGYNTSIYDEESAKEDVWKLIGLGVTPSADLIKRAGMSETDVSLAVAAVKAQQAPTTTSYTRQTNTAYDPDGIVETGGPTEITYETANQESARIYAEDGKDAVMGYIEELKQAGELTSAEYFRLVHQYYNKH